LIAVNHLEAHALTARLTDGALFPYCLFLAPAGNADRGGARVGDYVRLGTTRDDAIGEAFDKTAKLLGLGYPGGPRVRAGGQARRPRPLRLATPDDRRHDADFSLSGLKTAVRLEAEKNRALSDQDVADLCASFQFACRGGGRPAAPRPAAVPRTIRRTDGAGRGRRSRANQAIREAMLDVALQDQVALVVPPPALCTDNAAMIAWAGAERLVHGCGDTLDTSPRARWPLDEVISRRRSAGRSGSGRSGLIGCGSVGPGSGGDRVSMMAERIAVLGGRLGHRARQCHCPAGPPGDVWPRCRRCRRHRGAPGKPLCRARASTSASSSARCPSVERTTTHSHRGSGPRNCAVPRPPLRARSDGHAGRGLRQGIERGTRRFMTEVIAECLPGAVPAVLSGPSFAADVARGLPTAVTLAAPDEAMAQMLARSLGSATFRPYHSVDTRGVEIGGAAKNVLAIAAGIVTGRRLG